MKLGFIGGGVMAEALISGISNAGLGADITVGEPIAARRDFFASIGINATDDNAVAIKDADIVVLAVKPQQLELVAETLSSQLAPEQTVVSILAGIKMHSIGLRLNHGRLIRVMPNTPAQVGHGM